MLLVITAKNKTIVESCTAFHVDIHDKDPMEVPMTKVCFWVSSGKMEHVFHGDQPAIYALSEDGARIYPKP